MLTSALFCNERHDVLLYVNFVFPGITIDLTFQVKISELFVHTVCAAVNLLIPIANDIARFRCKSYSFTRTTLRVVLTLV